jgi:transposase
VRVPWAEPRARFTQLMERLIIDVILQCSTLTGACRIVQITWDGVMERAVACGRARKVARPIRYVGVDEKSFRKGHVYHTIVCDLERSTVEHVAEDRRVESLGAFFEQLTPAQRVAIDAVAMDMWDPYVRATREGLPDGEWRVVFDRFHIMREITTAVDLVRKHRALRLSLVHQDVRFL